MEVLFKERVSPAYVLRDSSPEDVASELIQQGQQTEPFYIFDMDEAHRRIKHFRDMMPRVQIFYAMKSNDTTAMLKLAIALGLGFDCASPGEIYKLRKLNVSPSSIIYAMPTKAPDQMIYAQKSGVRHTTFDTSYELKKLKEHWPDAKLLLRIRVESVSHIPLGEKFGCDFETEAVDLLDEAASLGLTVVGVAFHVGCVCSTIESYAVGLRNARALFDHEARAGRKMTILDIGGGYASDKTDSIDQISKLVNSSINELFPDPDIQIIAEPGRYVSDSSFTLYNNITNIRRIKKNGKLVNMLYVNDGIYGTMRYPEKWHGIRKFQVNNKADTSEVEDTILWGPSCDSMDQVRKGFEVRLPRCTPLDWLVFQNHGAYTITFSTRFSSIPIPLIRPVMSMKLWDQVKCSKVYSENDFIVDPAEIEALPGSLPPLLPKRRTEHNHTPVLEAAFAEDLHSSNIVNRQYI